VQRIRVAWLLGAVGFLDAAYLTYVHVLSPAHPGGLVGCTAASGCGAVLASRYARVAGIPTSAFGIAFYFAVMAAAARSEEAPDGIAPWLLRGLAAAGALVSAVLLGVQIFSIRALCPYCALSALASFALLAVMASGQFELKERTSDPARVESPSSS